MAKTIFIDIDECVWVNYHAEYTEEKYNQLKEYYKQYNQSTYDALASVSFDDVVDILNGDKEDIIFNYVSKWGDVYRESLIDIVKEDMRNCAYESEMRYGDVMDSVDNIGIVFDEEDYD